MSVDLISPEESVRDAEQALAIAERAGVATRHNDDAALLELMADGLLRLPYRTWFFGDSIAFEALIAASDRLGNERWIRFAHGWARSWATRATPYKRIDCTVPGRALVELAQRYGDRQLLDACRDLAEYLITRPTTGGVFETFEAASLLRPYGGAALDDLAERLLADPPAGVFLDCLHFDPPFFVSLGIALGDDTFIDVGVRQALGYIALLQQESGLFNHFCLRGIPGSFGPGWGRGQGWAILGLLDVIESLERSGRLRPELAILRQAAARLVDALVSLQRPDGHWYAVLTDEASGDEYSTAAFMADAFERALLLGVVSDSKISEAQRAARGAVLEGLDDRGRLREVSAAVYASTEPTHYAHVPRGLVVPWGQGPALLALLSSSTNDLSPRKA